MAQRGKASSRSPASCTVPTPSARRRGSRLETAGRLQTVAVAVVAPKRGGSRWGRSPRPQAVGAGNLVKSGNAQTEAHMRPACAVEQVSRAWSAPLEAGYGRWGAPVFMSAFHGVQPGKTPEPTSRRGKGGGELQPHRGCSFPLFLPGRTRG